jgi:hypothetical protein
MLTLFTRFQIHIRPLLRERSHLKTAVRVATEKQLCRQELDRKVEEAGLRKGVLNNYRPLYLPHADCSPLALLSSMHPDQGNQLQQHLHLSRTSQAAQGGPSHRVRQLRMQRMWKQRLSNTTITSLPAVAHHTIPQQRVQASAFSITYPAGRHYRPGSRRQTSIRTSATLQIGNV